MQQLNYLKYQPSLYIHSRIFYKKDIYEDWKFYLPSNSSPAVSLEGATLIHLRLTLKYFKVYYCLWIYVPFSMYLELAASKATVEEKTFQHHDSNGSYPKVGKK